MIRWLRLVQAGVLLWLVAGCAAPAYAQFGVGGRIAMIRADVDAEEDSQRFTGGHIRARMSPKTAFEVSLDIHSETDPSETTRVRDYPIQASLLLYPVGTTFAPYLLGGAGWYTRRVQALDSDEEVIDSVQTRDFGWHAGFGAELKLGRHAGIHADYRYTFLDWSDDDEDEDGAGMAAANRTSMPLVGGLLPSYKGSMWTVGLTFYF
ncbi:MAG TPA: outer membrane beta-barrel protein [Vicinamibacterales bacterium]|nr:outer membrane beta-barrel protein [Vicinamibacterales bacterium]